MELKGLIKREDKAIARVRPCGIRTENGGPDTIRQRKGSPRYDKAQARKGKAGAE